MLVGAYHFFSFESPVARRRRTSCDRPRRPGACCRSPSTSSTTGTFYRDPPDPDGDPRGAPRRSSRRCGEHYGVEPVIYATQAAYSRYIAGEFPGSPLWIRAVYLPPRVRRVPVALPVVLDVVSAVSRSGSAGTVRRMFSAWELTGVPEPNASRRRGSPARAPCRFLSDVSRRNRCPRWPSHTRAHVLSRERRPVDRALVGGRVDATHLVLRGHSGWSRSPPARCSAAACLTSPGPTVA